MRSADTLAANDWRRANPRFQGDNLAHNLALADAVAALALAWLLAEHAVAGTRYPAAAMANLNV